MANRILSNILGLAGMAAFFWACNTTTPGPDTPPPDKDPKTLPQAQNLGVPDPERPGEYKVPQEVYKTTFADIEALILKLNGLILSKNYPEWIKYLDEAYYAQNADPGALKKISESPILKRQGIKLKDLKDFFVYVVAPSRANATLEKIAFQDSELTKVVAYSQIDGMSVILYQLKLINGQWKISYW